jgi:hypothetical protein
MLSAWDADLLSKNRQSRFLIKNFEEIFMANPWKLYIDLTQAVPRRVGKVLAHNMPVGQTLGLVPLVALLEFQDITTWRGLVRSISVSVSIQGGALEVYQTLEVERHHD